MNRKTQNNPKNTTTPAVIEYIGIDAVIEAIRLHLDTNITWLDKVYHKAFKSYRSSELPGLTGQEIYPAIWQGHNVDLHDTIMNDNLNGYAWFFTQGEQTPIDEFQAGSQNMFSKEMVMIVWVNLDRIDTTLQYPYTENLKQEILNELGGVIMPEGSSFELINVIESDGNPEDIFEPFTIDLIKSQYFSFPRYGYRFNFNVTYTEECQI